MKVCQKSGVDQGKSQSRCHHCSKVFPSTVSSARHQLRDHQDTWAVIDMIQAGITEEEAGRLYTKSINQGVKTFGSYYSKTKLRQRKIEYKKSEEIKMEELDAGDEADWIVDDNINWEITTDQDQDEDIHQGGNQAEANNYQ